MWLSDCGCLANAMKGFFVLGYNGKLRVLCIKTEDLRGEGPTEGKRTLKHIQREKGTAKQKKLKR